MYRCLLTAAVAATCAAFGRAQQVSDAVAALDPSATAHCTWDADCTTPIVHGAADACHQTQARCEGMCSAAGPPVRTPTWCDGAAYPAPAPAPGGGADPSAPGCTWHDVDDLRHLASCELAGSMPAQAQCRQTLMQDLHPTCVSCLQANNHNVSACVLDATPHCMVHDAHDVS